jgi:hypothetical protein
VRVTPAPLRTSGDWQTPQPFSLGRRLRILTPDLHPLPYLSSPTLQSTVRTQWLAASSKWTYHILTPNKPSLPAFPHLLNFPLPTNLPSRSIQLSKTLLVPFDQPLVLGLPSRKWPKTTTFRTKRRQPPQNPPPPPVKPAPTTTPTLPNALATPKARESPKKQQKNNPSLGQARST